MRRFAVALCVVAFGVFLVADGVHRAETRWFLVVAGLVAIGIGVKNYLAPTEARPT
ncbi:hypothetical protein BH09GEM1_BH09GEM1_19630 [soil metagenome]